MSLTRVITVNSENTYTYQDKSDLTLKGICIDLWNQTAKDLNLTYKIEIATSWEEMITIFGSGEADVIINRMDDNQLKSRNITKWVHIFAAPGEVDWPCLRLLCDHWLQGQ